MEDSFTESIIEDAILNGCEEAMGRVATRQSGVSESNACQSCVSNRGSDELRDYVIHAKILAWWTNVFTSPA
jgi:hypothetical protein